MIVRSTIRAAAITDELCGFTAPLWGGSVTRDSPEKDSERVAVDVAVDTADGAFECHVIANIASRSMRLC